MVADLKNTSQVLNQFILMRLAVGYLGQGKQAGWWDCNFLDATGIRFLETTFPRTARAAALRATTEAACSVHDKALGRVGSYHLFRLPPAMEDLLEQTLEREDMNALFNEIQSHEAALETLHHLADALIHAPTGPVQVGVESRILTPTAVRELAAHYHSAFREGVRSYPYFAPDKDAR
ncbi:hypothetical protein SAMN05660860_00135 [Geoalkalibacter ferrihydriticus]|uniref:BrxE family protein n=1 Tax=Geoalkalibacter ferrihydriticus TaxID=392333 RepID=A0A1G9IGW8_9BACT|nr:BrxE family protein [Geoalkalibacter ferrihydriticus]SDL24480.1 hypothetical protein SAMN05660860_00135 [Geoalkalibacter ferrihydriticus]